MAPGKEWQRSPDGFRLDFGGINTYLPPDQLPETKYPYAQNIRRYKEKSVTSRSVEDDPVVTVTGNVHSIRRLNDTTPAGPAAGFVLIEGAGGNLFANFTQVNSGLSGNPLSLVPFRPNQSVQPWMYVADSVKMLKVRSDGLCYKMGIAEPQVAPNVQSNVAATVISTIGEVTTYVWGDSPHSGPVGQYIWRNPTDTGSSGPERGTANADVTVTGNSFLFDVAPNTNPNPMLWEILDSSGASLGSKSLFEPALESEGYADFNMAAVSSLYVPAAGTYTFTIASKDSPIWGIGDGTGGSPTWAGKGTTRGQTNQTKTVINGCPLMPVTYSNDGGGFTCSGSVAVTFPAAGIYPFEVDYDYWYHSNRTCTVKVNGSNIPPISGQIIVNAQYRYTYRSSATGAPSNPSPASVAISLPVSSTTLTPTPSTDPQVDKIDWYRLDSGLLSYTYVGTSPNTTVPFEDTLLDTDVINNPQLEFDNYEPFPSIDLPRSGTVNVSAGAVTGTMSVSWASGDLFNQRWLPGTVIIIGTVAYTLYNRPSGTNNLTVILSGDMPAVTTGLPYEIAEPILAAQPMPSMWGPTDNVNFMFACGDVLRPGVLYWTKGNNPDSAPDTNQQDVTSPSEPLMNGAIVNGIGMVFSTERAWLIYPNFFSVSATVSGTVGSAWTLQESISNRGLYIKNCICTDGGRNVYFRAKDGIYISPGGVGSESITDDIFNLFPHEGFAPVPIARGPYTLYPPDDSQPNKQSLRVANGYVYYDYVDKTNVPRTLVFDIAAKGWVVDVYGVPVTTHVLEEGLNINGVLVGCTDGTVRPLVSGAEASATTHIPPPLQGPIGQGTMHAGFYLESTRTLYWTENHSSFGYINAFNPVSGLTQVLVSSPGNAIPWIVSGSQGILVHDGACYYGTEGNTGSGSLVRVDLATGTVTYAIGGGFLNTYNPIYSMAIVTLSGVDYIVTGDLGHSISLTRAVDGSGIYRGPLTLLDPSNFVTTVGAGNVVVTDSANNTWCISDGHIAEIVWSLTVKPTPADYVVPDVKASLGAVYDPASQCIVYGTSTGAIVKWSTVTHSEVSRNSAAGFPQTGASPGGVSIRQLTGSGLILTATTDAPIGHTATNDIVRIFRASDLGLVSEYSLSALGLTSSLADNLVFTPNTMWFGRFYDETGPGIFVADTAQHIWYVPIPVPPFNEIANCVLLTQAVNAGDTRANKRIGDIFFRANIVPTNPVAVTPYSSIYTNLLSGYSPTALSAPTEEYLPFILDFTDGYGGDIDDIECIFAWAVGQTTYISLWQPNFIPLPENVQDRPTDYTDAGYTGAKFVQGVRMEADTFGQPKIFTIENGDDHSLTVPNETPAVFNGQSIQTFSFSPFIAHTLRMISTDGVPWRRWSVEYIFQPYPEECLEWTTELMSFTKGWQHVRMLNIPYIATAPISVTLNFDQWPGIVLTDELPASPDDLYPFKQKVNVPANKSKLIGFSLTSTQPFRIFKPMVEVLVGEWGRQDSYRLIQPFGGAAADGAEA